MSTKTQATLADLYRAKGKAELVGEEIVLMSPTGATRNYAAFEIAISLRNYARRTGKGRAAASNAGFRIVSRSALMRPTGPEKIPG